MKLKAFPAEPVNDPSSVGLVLPLCLTVNLGMGIHARVPEKAVTSTSLRNSPCTHVLAHVEQCGVPQFFAMVLEVNCFAVAPDFATPRP